MHTIVIRGFGLTPWLYGMLTVSLTLTGSCMLTSARPVGDKGGRMSKVTPELTALYDEYSAYFASHRAGTFRPTNPLVRVIGDRVVVDAVASEDVDVLKADLVSLGMQQAVAFGRIVSGQMPISAIPAMAALSSLNFARAASASTRGGQNSPGKSDR